MNFLKMFFYPEPILFWVREGFNAGMVKKWAINKQRNAIPLPPGGVRGGKPYKIEIVPACLAVALPQPLPEGGESGGSKPIRIS
jgi:hypothetical protein